MTLYNHGTGFWQTRRRKKFGSPESVDIKSLIFSGAGIFLFLGKGILSTELLAAFTDLSENPT